MSVSKEPAQAVPQRNLVIVSIRQRHDPLIVTQLLLTDSGAICHCAWSGLKSYISSVLAESLIQVNEKSGELIGPSPWKSLPNDYQN